MKLTKKIKINLKIYLFKRDFRQRVVEEYNFNKNEIMVDLLRKAVKEYDQISFIPLFCNKEKALDISKKYYKAIVNIQKLVNEGLDFERKMEWYYR